MRKKLRTFLTIALLIFAAGTIITAHNLRKANLELQRITNLHQMDSMRQGVLDSFSGINRLIRKVEKGNDQDLDKIISSTLKMENAIKGCRICHVDDGVAVDATVLEENIRKFQEAISFIVTSSANRERIDRLGMEAMDRGNDVLRKVETLHIQLNTQMHKSASQVISGIEFATYVFYLTIAAITGLYVILAFSLIRSVNEPINNLINGTRMIEAGDWGMKIDRLGDDEMGELGRHFNSMSAKLGQTMAALKRTNEELNEEIGKVRQAEAERQKLLDELINARKMEAVGTLAGGVAHEFNNLLQSIQASAEFLQLEPGGDDKRHKHLGSIIKASDRGAELTKRLLAFSQRLEGEMRPFNLQSAFAGLRNKVSGSIPGTVEFVINAEGEPLWITGDRPAFEDTLTNLVLNARDAVAGTGKITVELLKCHRMEDLKHMNLPEGCPGAAIINISDTGPGMDETMRQKIFEPFYTTKIVGFGAGLGLAIAYGVVKSHGGIIECRSAPGQGTVFTVRLPLVDPPV